MFQSENNARLCIIKPEGLLRVKLTTSPHMISGGDFKIFSEDGQQIIESFKLVAEDGGYSSRSLKHLPSQIKNCYLVWQILTCTSKVSVSDAELYVHIYQDNNLCKLSVPAVRHISNVPPCEVKNPARFTESLMFVHKV